MQDKKHHAHRARIQDAHSIRVVPVAADAIGAARGALGKTKLTKALVRHRAADKRHDALHTNNE